MVYGKRFLVKIQTNVNQRKHKHNNFLSEVSHTIKNQNLTIKIWVIFLYKNVFFFSRLNSFLYFGVLNAKFKPVSSQITGFLYSQLSPCGHPAITDTSIIRTADKFRAKINYRHLTEINSRY